MSRKNLALFDFDGTITTKDSLLEFIRFYKGTRSLVIGVVLFSPLIFLMKIRLLKTQFVKSLFLSYFFKHEKLEVFEQRSNEFGKRIIPEFISKAASKKLIEHIGDDIFIVSASLENYILPWAINLDLKVIGTRMEVINGFLTGRINGLNCKGKEKVRRINEIVNLNEYDKIYAYGDSPEDKEMLNIADFQHYGPI